MNTFKEQVISKLQLKFKWIRVMLISSAIIILGIIFIPTMKKEAMPQEYAKPMMDSTVVMNSDSSINHPTIHRQTFPRPANVNRNEPKPPPSAASDEETIKEKEPFDWKETITWGIGSLNALVLILMNIKNIFFKKSK
jgi:hypothetical protein